MSRFIYALSWMKKRRYHFFVGILFKGIVSFLSMYVIADFIAGITRILIDKVPELLRYQILRLIVGYLIVIIIDFIGNVLTMEACLYATKELRADIVKKILYSKVECLNNRSSDEVINAFTSDVSSIFDHFAGVAAIPVNILFAGGGGLIYALGLDPVIGCLIIIFGISKVVYGLLFAKKMRRINYNMLKMRSEFTSSVKQLLDNPISIRIFDMERILKTRYEVVVNDMKKCNVHNGDVSGMLGAVNNVTSEIFSRLTLFFLGNGVFADRYEMSDMMEQKEISINALSIFSISRILTDAQIILVGMERIIDFTKNLVEEDIGYYCGEDINKADKNAVEFHNVYFGYGNKLLLNDFSLSINKGSITILRGKSGTGKTSLLRLAQGIYIPEKGTIKVLGKDIREWNLQCLRDKMAYVPQQAFFFKGTVEENIAGGHKNVDRDRVIEAAREALIYDKIMKLPQGFNTLMTDNDSRFSGGEQKRLSLARAFYKNSEILLLDEITAAVDTENEKLIYEILKSKRGKQTIIFSTHRVLAEQIADSIIELNHASESSKV